MERAHNGIPLLDLTAPMEAFLVGLVPTGIVAISRLSEVEACTVVDVLPSNPHLVRPEFVDGWLSFQSERERRRYSPLPDDWERASEDQLRAWWMEAKPAPKPRPMI